MPRRMDNFCSLKCCHSVYVQSSMQRIFAEFPLFEAPVCQPACLPGCLLALGCLAAWVPCGTVLF